MKGVTTGADGTETVVAVKMLKGTQQIVIII